MAFTEFCCRSGGNNLYAGSLDGGTSETSTTPFKTYTGGTWVSGTGVFTVASGNPVNDGITVGQFASVYPDATTGTTPFVARITARTTTTITVSLSSKAGTAPISGTTNTTMVIGGAWAGPTGATAFPFGFVGNSLNNAAGDPLRVNFKGTFTITAAISHTNSGRTFFEGYTTTYGDGGRATLDGGATGSAYTLLTLGGVLCTVANWIIQNNGDSGTSDLMVVSQARCRVRRVTVCHARGSGLSITSGVNSVISCEAFDCNQSNTAAKGGFATTNTVSFFNCISHNNTGSNTAGFYLNGSSFMNGCIADTNGGHGFQTAAVTTYMFECCVAYGNAGSGAHLGTGTSLFDFFNCVFSTNGAYGINQTVATSSTRLYSCAFYNNTTLKYQNIASEEIIDEVICGSEPMADPANGDFLVTLTAVKTTGYIGFVQDSGSYSKTTTYYPDIGLQHQDNLARPILARIHGCGSP